MKNRFDLEQEIGSLYSYTEQLGGISEGILEYNMSSDDVVNAIEGLRVMLDLHAQKMMDTLSQCFHLDYGQTDQPCYMGFQILRDKLLAKAASNPEFKADPFIFSNQEMTFL